MSLKKASPLVPSLGMFSRRKRLHHTRDDPQFDGKRAKDGRVAGDVYKIFIVLKCVNHVHLNKPLVTYRVSQELSLFY